MAGIDAGTLTRKVVIERAMTTRDEFNAEVQTWTLLFRASTCVTFGTGQERRAAAQEGASAPATFRIRWNSTTRTITPADRLQFMDAVWDITSVVPFGFNEGLDITAVRAA